MELPMPHIDTDHALHPMLQKTIGKAPGRLTYVECDDFGCTQSQAQEPRQSRLELEPAPRNIAQRWVSHIDPDGCVVRDPFARAGHGTNTASRIYPNAARCNQALRQGAGCGQATFDQDRIGTHSHRLRPSGISRPANQ